MPSTYYTRQIHFLLSTDILYLGKKICMAQIKKKLKYNSMIYSFPSEKPYIRQE